MKKTLISLLVTLALPALAQMTPAGVWRSIDDGTGEAKAEISIKDNGKGGLNGVVARSLINSSKEPNCSLCTDEGLCSDGSFGFGALYATRSVGRPADYSRKGCSSARARGC